MQPKSLIAGGVVVVLIIAFLYAYNYYSAPQSQPEKIVLSEPQIIACYTADDEGTCFTKLADLDFVSPATCCQVLEVCC